MASKLLCLLALGAVANASFLKDVRGSEQLGKNSRCFIGIAGAGSRIDIKLSVLNNYLYVANLQFGNHSNGNGTVARVLLDTQNEWSFVMGSNCSTCVNSNKYPFNSTQTIGSFPNLNVRNASVSGHSVSDMACLID